MACPICGKNCNKHFPAPGAGVTITRLTERSKDMASVTLSKERWCVTADKSRAVKEDDPEAAFLLVGKGGAIAPEVAQFYGIETYTGESVERVSDHPAQERERMVTEGTPASVADNYSEMALNRDVREKVSASLTTEGNRSANRQGEMMAQAIINKAKAEREESPAPVVAEPTTRTKEIPSPDNPEAPATDPVTDADAEDFGPNGDGTTPGFFKETPPPAATPPIEPPKGPDAGASVPTGQAGEQGPKDDKGPDGKDKTL